MLYVLYIICILAVVCSLHFAPYHYKHNDIGAFNLKSDAVPL